MRGGEWERKGGEERGGIGKGREEGEGMRDEMVGKRGQRGGKRERCKEEKEREGV